ncbi:MAG: diacylglycerol kinase family lipid kinase [Clostridia bacterium]|nr:diacylglycerol kinase family lipid kinase [Clostridia bacterium]
MVKSLLLVVNPTSGTGRHRSELMEIVKVFCDAEFSVNVHVTRCRGDALRHVAEYGNDYDIVVACGGDGTLSEVIGGAMRGGFQGDLGFLPYGTTNDFATTLGLPRKRLDIARLITYREGRPVDFGTFNRTRYFSYVAAFGAFTDVTYTTDQISKNLFGHAAYVAEALSKVKDLRPYFMRVDCDGEHYEGEFLFGAVTNSLSIGGVMKLKKDQVALSDGCHEVILIRRPKTASELASLSKELLSGNYENRSVLFFRGKKIRFTAEVSIPWTVDGEYAGTHEVVDIRNLHGRLKVIYP